MAITKADYDQVVSKFVQECGSAFQKNLVSIIAKGSYARGDIVPGRSYVSLMLVFRDLNECLMENLYKVFSNNSARPVLLAPMVCREDELPSLREHFPLSFFELKNQYKVLKGKDVLGRIPVPPKALIKKHTLSAMHTVLINLREKSLVLQMDRGAYIRLRRVLWDSCYQAARYALYLKKNKFFETKKQVIDNTEKVFTKLPNSLILSDLYAANYADDLNDPTKIRELHLQAIEFVEELFAAVGHRSRAK